MLSEIRRAGFDVAQGGTHFANVRFGGQNGHAFLHRKCPLLTQSGHGDCTVQSAIHT
jgi:hypothetical protein